MYICMNMNIFSWHSYRGESPISELLEKFYPRTFLEIESFFAKA